MSLGLMAALIEAGALMFAAGARAQEYPSKPIRVVVDMPPGGINDIIVRRIGQRLTETLGQPVFIDNRPGASGTIAADEVAKATPDGYTVLFGGMSSMVVYPSAGGRVKYDPQNGFIPTAIGAAGYPVLAVNSALGIHTLHELVDYARKSTSQLSCGTGGNASVYHFACALAAQALGLPLQMVPYKGSTFAIQDAAGGQIQLVTAYPSEIDPFIKSGKLIGLAILGPVRLPRYPTVATFEEQGYAGVVLPSFNGFYFPARTPVEIVDKVNQASNWAMRQPENVEALRTAGSSFMGYPWQEFAAFVDAERAKWKRIADTTGIRAEP